MQISSLTQPVKHLALGAIAMQSAWRWHTSVQVFCAVH